MAASLQSDEELVAWFRQRLVWDDPGVVQDLLRRGLFSRIYTPQVLVVHSFCFRSVTWRRRRHARLLAKDMFAPHASAPVQSLLTEGHCSRRGAEVRLRGPSAPQVIIRGFMILNEAEEQRKVANSAPLKSADVLQTAAVSSTAPAATHAAANETPGLRAASVSEPVTLGSVVPQAARKAARVTGNTVTALAEAAGNVQRGAGVRAAGSLTDLSLTASAPASVQSQAAVTAAQK